jgi:hypothetical protein
MQKLVTFMFLSPELTLLKKWWNIEEKLIFGQTESRQNITRHSSFKLWSENTSLLLWSFKLISFKIKNKLSYWELPHLYFRLFFWMVNKRAIKMFVSHWVLNTYVEVYRTQLTNYRERVLLASGPEIMQTKKNIR